MSVESSPMRKSPIYILDQESTCAMPMLGNKTTIIHPFYNTMYKLASKKMVFIINHKYNRRTFDQTLYFLLSSLSDANYIYGFLFS